MSIFLKQPVYEPTFINLWFNVIGGVILVGLAHVLNPLWPAKA